MRAERAIDRAMEEPGAAAEWRAHWPMVLAAMLAMSFYSMVTYSFGTFIEPLQREFGWDRETISLGLSIFGGVAALGGPFVGALIDRVGTRTVAIFGLGASGLGFAAIGFANGSVSQWAMLWVLFGTTALFMKSTIWSSGVSSVFTASRGLALAAMLSGSAVGQTFAPIIANALIRDHGWRFAYRAIGLGWAGLAFVLVLLFYRDARSLGHRAAARGNAGANVLLPGLTWREGLRDQRIVRIAVANVLMSIVGAGITAHLVPLVVEAGMTKDQAVGIAASAGIAGLAGKFLTGWLFDRLPQGNLLPFVSFAVAALGDLLLLRFHSVAALTMAVMALGYAAGAGLQVSTYLVSRYAGLRAFGVLFGIIAAAMMLGTSIGPWLAGRVHDVYGTYDPLLMAAIPVVLLAALMFVGLGRYPDYKVVDEATPVSALVPEAAT